MIIMIFVLGALLGVLAGGALCVRYLRQEVAADIGPKLRRIQQKLDNLELEINLVLTTRLAELSGPHPIPPPLRGKD
jgi:hypothetical protein